MMPDPKGARENLGRLIGTFRGTETMSPSEWAPDGFVADSETISREALGGFGVVTDYCQKKGGQTTYEGHGVYTWDGGAGEVVLHWFDSMGMGRDEFRGQWDGDVLQLRCENAMGHQRITWTFGPDGPLSSRMEMGTDEGSLKSMMEAQYSRAT